MEWAGSYAADLHLEVAAGGYDIRRKERSLVHCLYKTEDRELRMFVYQ